VLTNQSGVAQGMYTEEDVKILHEKMNKHFIGLSLTVDDWFYCTEYNSDRRKPRPGMMIDAQLKYNIDLTQSFMVGDKVSDILEISGPRTFLLRGNYPIETVAKHHSAEIFNSLAEILEHLKKIL
jgi:HAD superfamily hydrolase (TIGR01662 family)